MSFPDLFQFFLFETTRYLAPQAVAAEWILLAIAVLLVATLLYRIPLRKMARWFRRLAARRRLAIALCFAVPLVIRLSLLGVMPVPDPSIHDEFSHLLLGDTLAHGRLANPPHPLWHHFESIHILQQPTYASMYPPAQGAFLAVGQVAFGSPWAGVLLSVGLMCAAICWMLQGWFPPAWALFGTVIVICKICLTGIWINSYLGGSPAAIGAALVVGAIAARRRYPVIFGLGLVVLMNSRPFEGALLGLLALLYLFLNQALNRTFVSRAALVLSAGVLFAGYYNFRVTGKPLQMPYMLNRASYGWPENLGFLPPIQLAPLRNAPMEAMRQKELANRTIYTDWRLFLENLDTKFFDNWTYFLGPVLSVPLFFAGRRRRTWALVRLLGALLALNLVQMVLYPYHLGPAVPLIFAAVLLGVRALYVTMKRHHPAHARAMLVALPATLVLIAAMKEFAPELRLPLAYWETGHEPHRDARAAIQRFLMERPGPQLVIVRYGPGHSPSQEWVYNRANIDKSKVVWARELQDNEELLTYYANRTKWLLKADEYPQRVVPYR